MGYSYGVFVDKTAFGHFALLAALQLVTFVIAFHHVKVHIRGIYGDVLGICGVEGRAVASPEDPANIGNIMDQLKGLYLQSAAGFVSEYCRLSRIQDGDVIGVDLSIAAKRYQKISAADKADGGAVFVNFMER